MAANEDFAMQDVAGRTEGSGASTMSSNVATMGQSLKDLINAITRLEQLGIEKSNIPLPRVVAIGDQSAGKSSNIEGISEIRLPKCSGTGTRCPFHLKMESAPTWSFRVYLSKPYAYMPGLEKQYGQLFYPWVEQDMPTTIDFKTVATIEELEDVLLRAHMATLNPKHEPTSYLHKEIGSLTDKHLFQADFSPNPVCVDIFGPDLPSLSFVDLPGIINQTEDRSKRHLVDLIRNLVEQYISSPHTLILLAVAMENDLHNSTALRLVNDIHGASERCIGVLTKPDRLPSGDTDYDKWKRVLLGREFALGHEWYVTKQPSQSELKEFPTHREARTLEKEFFKRPPWNTALGDFRDRFGTSALQTALSKKLGSLIFGCLPEIRQRVGQRLAELDEQLAQLPEPPKENAMRIVMDTINDFADLLRKDMDGDHPHNEWRRTWKVLRGELYTALSEQKPKMVKTVPSDKEIYRDHAPQHTQDGSDMAVIIDSDDESPAPQPTPTSGEPPFTTPKKRKAGSAAHYTPLPKRQHGNPQPVASLAASFRLTEIREILDDISNSDIPGECDPKALQHLISISLSKWDNPLYDFFRSLRFNLEAKIDARLSEVFRNWQTAAFARESRHIVHQFLNNQFLKQDDSAAPRTLSLERYKAFSGDNDVWEREKKEELDILEKARKEARAAVYFIELERATGKRLSPQERDRKIKQDAQLGQQINNDPYQREVEVLAKVRGYYNLASLRFYDVICQGVQGELFEALRVDVANELWRQLKLNQPDVHDTCIKLLAEDSHRVELRIHYTTEKRALTEAQATLDALTTKLSAPIPASAAAAAASSSSAHTFVNTQNYDAVMDYAV